MSFLQAAGLAVRLFSLWLFLFALQSMLVAFNLNRSPQGAGSALDTLVLLSPGIIALVLGIFLWRFPLAVARLLVPRTSDNAASITLAEAWRLGSVLIGLLVLSQAGPLLLRMLVFIHYSAGRDFGGPVEELQAALWEALAKTAFGLFLVFGNGLIYRRFGQAA